MAKTIKAAQSDTTLQIKRTFKAPREKVFNAWTDPAVIKQWFAPTDEFSVPVAEVDLRVGGKYRIAMQAPDGARHIAVGAYREIDAPRKLVFTWTWEQRPMPDTLITIEFNERAGATEVVLTHELFPSVEERDHHNQGWIGCLDRLAKVV
jgi:uncharacterized protein YndB with AHSA1/START domain